MSILNHYITHYINKTMKQFNPIKITMTINTNIIKNHTMSKSKYNNYKCRNNFTNTTNTNIYDKIPLYLPKDIINKKNIITEEVSKNIFNSGIIINTKINKNQKLLFTPAPFISDLHIYNYNNIHKDNIHKTCELCYNMTKITPIIQYNNTYIYKEIPICPNEKYSNGDVYGWLSVVNNEQTSFYPLEIVIDYKKLNIENDTIEDITELKKIEDWVIAKG